MVTTLQDTADTIYTCPGCGIETQPAHYDQSGAFCSYRCWLIQRDDAPSFK